MWRVAVVESASVKRAADFSNADNQGVRVNICKGRAANFSNADNQGVELTSALPKSAALFLEIRRSALVA